MIYNDLPYAGEMNKKGIQTADSHVKTGGCKDFDRVIRWNSLVSSVSDWKNPAEGRSFQEDGPMAMEHCHKHWGGIRSFAELACQKKVNKPK